MRERLCPVCTLKELYAKYGGTLESLRQEEIINLGQHGLHNEIIPSSSSSPCIMILKSDLRLGL